MGVGLIDLYLNGEEVEYPLLGSSQRKKSLEVIFG